MALGKISCLLPILSVMIYWKDVDFSKIYLEEKNVADKT